MMATPTVDPFYREGMVKFFVGNGASKKLIFNRAELVALRAAIDVCLEANRAHTT